MCIWTSSNNTNDAMLPPNNIQPNFIETKAFAFAPQSHNSHYTHFWAMLITPQNHSPFRRYWGRRKEGKKLAHTHTHRHTHRHTDTHTHTHTHAKPGRRYAWFLLSISYFLFLQPRHLPVLFSTWWWNSNFNFWRGEVLNPIFEVIVIVVFY